MVELSGDPDAPSGVARPQCVRLTVGGQQLRVFTGVAVPELTTSDDSTPVGPEVIVRLPGPVGGGYRASACVNLASISNSESDFRFGADQSTLDLDPETGDLRLHVDLALLGNTSWLHRFAYHVTVIAPTVGTQISGIISWDPRWGDPRDPVPTFRIASGYEDPPGPGGLGPGPFHELAAGYSDPAQLVADEAGTDMWQARYVVTAALPLGTNVVVRPALIGGLSGPPSGFGPGAAFEPAQATVQLSPAQPSAVANFQMTFLAQPR